MFAHLQEALQQFEDHTQGNYFYFPWFSMPGSRPAWEGEQGEAAQVQLLRITAQTCAGEAVEVTLRSLPGQQKNCIRKSRITGNETERWLSAWRLQYLSSSSGLWSSPAADWSHFCILPTKIKLIWAVQRLLFSRLPLFFCLSEFGLVAVLT